MGDGFAAKRLGELKLKDEKQTEVLRATLEKINRLIADRKKALDRQFAIRFRRAAWLKYAGHPQAEPYLKWLGEEVGKHREDLTKFFDKNHSQRCIRELFGPRR